MIGGSRLSPGPAPRFPLLDSVRALAALAVVVFHAGFWSRVTESGSVAAPFLSRLDVGVTVFFVLSGFLLYRPFARARLLGVPRPSARAYGWRRVLRIVPAYWVALTLIALWIPKPDTFEPGHAIIYYGFLQIYSDLVLGGIGQAWTLCVEVSFYALLPLWAWSIARAPRTVRAELLALAGLALAGIAWNVAFTAGAADPSHANTARALIWLPAFLDQFALGMGMAVLSVAAERDARLPGPVAWVARRPGLSWLAAGAAFVVVAVGIGLEPENRLDAPVTAAQALGRHWLYAIVAAGLVAPAVFGPAERGAVRRVLAHPALLWVGLVSYGLYLWHNAVMEKVGPGDGSWADFALLLAVGLLGGLVAAALSWRLVERPMLGLKRLVPDRAVPPRDPETHVPSPAAR